ncbi:hypothetical protein BD770DRAFT_391537 [Pilaira anomala]|nr:hypothetical protein BD770DRAFT_391537 [Pilaira anomala]
MKRKEKEITNNTFWAYFFCKLPPNLGNVYIYTKYGNTGLNQIIIILGFHSFFFFLRSILLKGGDKKSIYIYIFEYMI